MRYLRIFYCAGVDQIAVVGSNPRDINQRSETKEYGCIIFDAFQKTIIWFGDLTLKQVKDESIRSQSKPGGTGA